jgi:hypothetical protein
MLKIESIERAAKQNAASRIEELNKCADQQVWHPSLTTQNRKAQLIHRPRLPAATIRYRKEATELMQQIPPTRKLLEPHLIHKGNLELHANSIITDDKIVEPDSHLPNPLVEKPKSHLTSTSIINHRKFSHQIKEVQQSVSKFMLPLGSPRSSQDMGALHLPQISQPVFIRDTKHSTLSGSFDPSETLSIRHRSPHQGTTQATILPTSHLGYMFPGGEAGHATLQKVKSLKKYKSSNTSLILKDDQMNFQPSGTAASSNRPHPLADYLRQKMVKVSDYYSSDGGHIYAGKISHSKYNKSNASGEANLPSKEMLIESNLKLLLTEEVRDKFEEAVNSLSGLFHKFGITELSGIATIQLLLNYDASVSKATINAFQKSDKHIQVRSSSPAINQISSPRYMANKADQGHGCYVYMEKSFSVRCFAEGYLRHIALNDKNFGLFSLNSSYYRLYVDKIARFLEKVLSTYKLVELRSSTSMQLCYRLVEEKRTYKRLLSVACSRLKIKSSGVDESSTPGMLNPFPGLTWPLDTLEAKMVDYLFFNYIPEFVGPDFEKHKQHSKRLMEMKIRSLTYPKGIDPADFLELQDVMSSNDNPQRSNGSESKQQALEKQMDSIGKQGMNPTETSQRKFGVLRPSPGDFRSDWSSVIDQCVNKDVLTLKEQEFDSIFGGLKELKSAKKLKEMKAINVKVQGESLKPMSRVKELLIYQREMTKVGSSFKPFKEDSEER